ncbi:SusD family protein [Bacteroidales bacterium Barb6XT]|nr:SusD family protein [Bacteroidales bacterium Barb6XT]
MKKILYILTLSAALAACTDDLKLTPVDQLVEGYFPLTDADAIAAVNGIYQYNVISTSYGYLTDLTSELEVSGENPSGAGGLLGSIQWQPSNSYFNSVWNSTFLAITTANDVINKLQLSNSVTETLKNRLIGEAKFLRAYYYQYAVQFWGEVPLILNESEGTGASRAPIDEVYKQIVKDFQEAAEALPPVSEYPSSDKGRATQGAAYAFLSKIHLIWGQTSDTFDAAAQKEHFRLSIDYANKVTGYELEENYADNWVIANKNGKENIFAAQHALTQNSDGSGANHLAHCAFASGFTDAPPHMIISDIKFYNAFDDRDQRKTATYAKTLFNPTTGEDFEFTLPRYRKYIDTSDPDGSASNRNIDRTIIRYAEIFLLRAEAINEYEGRPTAQAYNDINTVRRRAFRHPLNEPSIDDIPAGLDYEGFKKAIQEERVFELTYEQNRWTDLVRWRIYVKTLQNSGVDLSFGKQNVSPKNYRFPIPESQRNINPEGLWQNWGYDGYEEAKTGVNPYKGFE